jgi:hypothetical protein
VLSANVMWIKMALKMEINCFLPKDDSFGSLINLHSTVFHVCHCSNQPMLQFSAIIMGLNAGWGLREQVTLLFYRQTWNPGLLSYTGPNMYFWDYNSLLLTFYSFVCSHCLPTPMCWHLSPQKNKNNNRKQNFLLTGMMVTISLQERIIIWKFCCPEVLSLFFLLCVYEKFLFILIESLKKLDIKNSYSYHKQKPRNLFKLTRTVFANCCLLSTFWLLGLSNFLWLNKYMSSPQINTRGYISANKHGNKYTISSYNHGRLLLILPCGVCLSFASSETVPRERMWALY